MTSARGVPNVHVDLSGSGVDGGMIEACLDAVGPGRDIVGRSRRDRGRRQIDKHGRRFRRAIQLRRRHQHIARHQSEMRGTDDRRSEAPAPELLASVRVLEDERLSGHFASRSSSPTRATLRNPAERSAFMTSMTSP